MSVPAQTDTTNMDFKGLIDVIENSLDYGEKQTNLQLIVMQQMTTRPGVREVVFEDEND